LATLTAEGESFATLQLYMQVLSGVLLLGVALGMALGGRGKEKQKNRSVLSKWAVAILALIIFASYNKLYIPLGYSGQEYYHWLNATDIIFSEFEDGLPEQARIDAEASLRLAGDYRLSWNYGSAIFEANTVLGLVSIREGKVPEAGTYLLEAGSSPGSPQLNSFGPRMELANMLLRQRRQDVVLRYLDLCGLFGRAGAPS
jgi:hypothetical protein